jgi:hypothetical protein
MTHLPVGAQWSVADFRVRLTQGIGIVNHSEKPMVSTYLVTKIICNMLRDCPHSVEGS